IRHFHRMDMGLINLSLNHFNAFFSQNAGHLIATEVTVKVDHGVNLSFTGNKLRQMLAIFGKRNLSIEAKLLESFLSFTADRKKLNLRTHLQTRFHKFLKGFYTISAGKNPIRLWIFVNCLYYLIPIFSNVYFEVL